MHQVVYWLPTQDISLLNHDQEQVRNKHVGPSGNATHHTFRHVSLYKLIQLHEIKGKCKEGPLEDAQKSHKDPTPPSFP